MASIDTNVLVRFLVEDDDEQARIADTCISSFSDENTGFVPREVVLELVWVLQFTYDFSRAQIAEVLRNLILARELRVEGSTEISDFMDLYHTSNFDLADLLIVAAASYNDSSPLVTFDKKLAQLGDVQLLE